MNRVTVAVMVTFVALLLVSGLVAYLLRDQPNAVTPTSSTGAVAAPAGSETQARNQVPLLGQLFGPDASGLSPSTFASWEATSARIALRFSLAAFLASLLAFRPRRGARNPYVAQTQILMAVVAGAMMMVVGDSAARAFGIFAAASLVRFRTNIRDPKETTVLLVCLGVGLAAGVGRWDMAVILTLFVLIALSVLEYFERFQVFRSMEVKVQTRSIDRTDEVLKGLFERYNFEYELRELNREDADEPLGTIVYLVNLDPVASTSKLSEEILSGDRDNVDSVEWDQKESKTYIYR
ncbi:MAG TPA: DUF4956 domain-containing protein [Pyrinomonadaceae bacterium]|jgi:uncharacterized membrane protein YhiD involved in acid resistance